MPFLVPRAWLALALVGLSAACQQPPDQSNSEATREPPAEPAAKQPQEPRPIITAENDPGLKPTTEPLTAEEERLIAADPKTLTPDEARARAHALRKKIMLDPDSPQAQALKDARAAALAGEVDPLAGETKAEEGLVLQLPPHLQKPPPQEPPK